MNDEEYIRKTLELAEIGAGLTSPGAMVGAVVVKNGAIVGEGFYTYDGIHHAETIALKKAGEAARGATVYTFSNRAPTKVERLRVQRPSFRQE